MGLLRDSWDSGDNVSRVFVAGVVAKGLNGVAEVVGGTVLFLVSRDLLVGLLGGVAERMMSDDPGNFIGQWILNWSKGGDLSEASISFVATYLLLHGIAKLLLVGALRGARTSWSARPWRCGRRSTALGLSSSGPFWALRELLGEHHDDAAGTAHVRQLVDVLVGRHTA